MTTKPDDKTQAPLAQRVHSQCLVCGSDDPLNLKLQFQPGEDGSMTVVFPGEMRFQGYTHRLHGGMIATLFDTAMTHCLFASELTGVTASLNVRFLLPVSADQRVQVRAWIERSKLQLCRLKGHLHQKGILKARAEATFWLDGGPEEHATGEV